MISQGSICSVDIKTIEQVHEGVEKVDESESIKEHAIHGESDLKEIHTVSAGEEILEKVS